MHIAVHYTSLLRWLREHGDTPVSLSLRLHSASAEHQTHLRVQADVLGEPQPRLSDPPHVGRRHHKPAAHLRRA